MANTPQLNVRLLGEEDTTTLNRTISWVPAEKVEITLQMVATSVAKLVDLSVISRVRTIVFNGDGVYKITITTGTYGDTQSLTIETQDFFIFSPSIAFMQSIYSIQVSTTSSVPVNIEVRAYGESN